MLKLFIIIILNIPDDKHVCFEGENNETVP